ncbi:MAG: DnaJ domain-containing protein [Nitrospira sp.]|jgi:curved DNA-binding protein CbpA|nr:DnaJ domain-containing protein [Nitrospira sp.]
MQHERTTNYYAILELSPDATEAEIRRAWHEHMQVWHPDRFVHSPTLHRKAEVRTQLINQAYQTLSDPTARARYDAGRQHPSSPTPTPPPRPSPPARPQPAARPRQELRGPQTMLNVTRFSHPKIMVPAIHLLVDVHETQPYEFKGLVRIAGTRKQALPAGDYAIAEAPDIFCVERRRVEEFNTIFSNPSENRPRFLRELEPLRAIPHRFLVIEGAIQYNRGGGRLGQYHRNGLIDFLDSLTARFGLQIVHAESREEAEERVANLAAIHYAYHLAEQEGLGRCLTENDA